MSEQIDAMIDRARFQAEDARALAVDYGETFLVRPIENRWSPAEQIEHISMTDRPYMAIIDQTLREAQLRGVLGDGPFRGGKIGNWFANAMSPPVKKRMKTMKKLHPAPDLVTEDVIQRFEAVRSELAALLERSRGVDLDRATMRSPYLKLLKMPLYSAFQVLLNHGDRHLWLARAVLEV